MLPRRTRRENEPFAGREPGTGAHAVCELERSLCPPGGGQSPPLKARHDLQHRVLAVEENDVDPEAHEEGVNRSGRLDQKPFVLG